MLSALFTYACLGYVAIAFTCHMIYCWQNPHAIELKRFDARLAAVEPIELPLLLPPATLPHPFEMSLERMSALETIAAVHQPAATPELSADALDVGSLPEAIDIPAPIDYASLTSAELRKHCGNRGIKWRSVKQGKHLSKREMLALLS